MTIYTPHFNETPTVHKPIIRSIRSFWCKYIKSVPGFNYIDGWSEGENYLAPDRALYSNCDILELERYRKGEGYEIDTKGHYDGHEIMFIVTFQIGSEKKERFYKPEHLFQILNDANVSYDETVASEAFPPQPEYEEEKK